MHQSIKGVSNLDDGVLYPHLPLAELNSDSYLQLPAEITSSKEVIKTSDPKNKSVWVCPKSTFSKFDHQLLKDHVNYQNKVDATYRCFLGPSLDMSKPSQMMLYKLLLN
jgi:hypothetical protein